MTVHEQTLLRDLKAKVEQLARDHAGARIVRARVALGPLAHLDEPRLRALWSEAMADGPAASARLEVEPVDPAEDRWASAVVLRAVTFEEGTGDSGRLPPPEPLSHDGG